MTKYHIRETSGNKRLVMKADMITTAEFTLEEGYKYLTGSGFNGALYPVVSPDDEIVPISLKALQELVRSELELIELEGAGVDNWQGYYETDPVTDEQVAETIKSILGARNE